MMVLRILLLASSLIGCVFVYIVYGTVPPWLFYSLVAGLAGFLVAMFLALRGKNIGYWMGFILAVVTLLVSLPAPAHIRFITSGMVLQSLLFIFGNILQLAYIILFVKHTLQKR